MEGMSYPNKEKGSQELLKKKYSTCPEIMKYALKNQLTDK